MALPTGVSLSKAVARDIATTAHYARDLMLGAAGSGLAAYAVTNIAGMGGLFKLAAIATCATAAAFLASKRVDNACARVAQAVGKPLDEFKQSILHRFTRKGTMAGALGGVYAALPAFVAEKALDAASNPNPALQALTSPAIEYGIPLAVFGATTMAAWQFGKQNIAMASRFINDTVGLIVGEQTQSALSPLQPAQRASAPEAGKPARLQRPAP